MGELRQQGAFLDDTNEEYSAQLKEGVLLKPFLDYSPAKIVTSFEQHSSGKKRGLSSSPLS